MTEQEEAVGRQRLKVLQNHQRRLIELETNMEFLFTEGEERYTRAQADHDTLVAIIAALELDASVVAVQLSDAEKLVAGTNERLAEAQSELAIRQATVDRATAAVTEAQSALDALKTP